MIACVGDGATVGAAEAAGIRGVACGEECVGGAVEASIGGDVTASGGAAARSIGDDGGAARPSEEVVEKVAMATATNANTPSRETKEIN